MHTLHKHGPARILCAAPTFLLFLALLPVMDVQAAQVSVKVNRGSSLQNALLTSFSQDGEVPYDEIDRLIVTGNGKLTDADGLFIRENLTSLHTLNLRGFTGDSGDGAFRGCIFLKTVLLPERFVISREMFYGCSSLEDVVWPVRYQLTKDCFAYCALDFSNKYPNLLNDRNVLTYAANQRPKVYFSMPRGNDGSINTGQPFTPPYELQTRNGSSYPDLIAQKPNWLLTRDAELEVSTVIVQDAERLDSLNTAEPGLYQITYSLPYATYADTRTQTYALTILPSQKELAPLMLAAQDKVQSSYTSESWDEMQSALRHAEKIANNKAAVRQTDMDAAREDLAEALDELELALEGAPENAVYPGDSFSLRPTGTSAQGSSGWAWDKTFFDVAFRNGGTLFTALQAGDTEIVYTNRNGEQGRLALSILAEGDTPAPIPQKPAPPPPEVKPSESGLWIFAAALYLAIFLALASVWWVTRKQDKL